MLHSGVKKERTQNNDEKRYRQEGDREKLQRANLD